MVRGHQIATLAAWLLLVGSTAVEGAVSTATPNFGHAVSPDGTTIAFVSEQNGDFDVYLMRADGTGLRNLTRHPASDVSPVFSPDGARLAFVSDRDGGSALYVMATSGRELPVVLTEVAQGDVFDPVFSPQGSAIAYAVRREATTEVWVVRADGAERSARVSRPGEDAFGPAFAADGQSLAYQVNTDAGIRFAVTSLQERGRIAGSSAVSGGPATAAR